MNVAKEAETRALLQESQRIREQLATAVRELDTYVKALEHYVQTDREESE